jgi:hypothetical protein
MKNRIPLIITAAIVIIAVVFVYLWMLGLLIPKGTTIDEKPSVNITPVFSDKNLSLRRLPPDIRDEVLFIDNSIPLNKWEFNSTNNNVINLYAYDIRNKSEISGLQGKQIGNYTIFVIHDIEFETTRSEVEEYLRDLMSNPDYQIATFGIGVNHLVDPTEYFVDLWCYSSTSENKKLDKTVIKGWKIIVRPMAPPPTQLRLNTSHSRTPS